MKKIRWKSLIPNLLVPLAVGCVSALITKDSMSVYESIVKPKFAPPSILFPVVWTILFLLMGVSAYLVDAAPEHQKLAARGIYWMQLAANFFWPLFFFLKRAFLASFLWLILLWILILTMIVLFYRINKTAALLQIPYAVWVTFAGILNLSVYLLNR